MPGRFSLTPPTFNHFVVGSHGCLTNPDFPSGLVRFDRDAVCVCALYGVCSQKPAWEVVRTVIFVIGVMGYDAPGLGVCGSCQHCDFCD
jgi:hypothetical protein